MVEDRREERRGAREHRDPLPAHQVEQHGYVGHRGRVDRGTAEDRSDEAALVARNMGEGADEQIAVPRSEADAGRPRPGDVDRLGVRRHDPLRSPRRPGREDDVGQVLVAHHGEIVVRRAVHVVVPGGRAEQDRPLHARVAALQQAHIVEPQEALDGEEQSRPGSPEHVGRFVALVAGGHGHHDTAGGVYAESRHDPLPRVGSPDGGAIARADSRRQRRAGGAPDDPTQTGKGQADIAVDQRLGIGPPLGSHVEEVNRGVVGAHFRTGLSRRRREAPLRPRRVPPCPRR